MTHIMSVLCIPVSPPRRNMPLLRGVMLLACCWLTGLTSANLYSNGDITCKAVVIAAGGCSFDGDERAAVPVDTVVDTTGAGDALAAGWIVGGPDLALAAAARCVRQAGAMP